MTLISVCVLCYNHEKYIEQTLKGILNQEGNFELEILVHDDASTDNSQKIIKKYEKLYKDIIKPIYQSENQYKKGITNLSGLFNFPRAKGKYIAMCEGDDYWTDKHKLNKQLIYMQEHNDCSFCFHSAKNHIVDGSFIEKYVKPYKSSCVVSSGEVIRKKKGYPTASLFFRRKYIVNLPTFYFDCAVGDIPLQLILAKYGYAYYMNEPMCAYRVGDSGSWSNRAKMGDYYKKQQAYLSNMLEMYDKYDEYSDFIFHNDIIFAKDYLHYQIALNTKDYKIIYDKKYKDYLKGLSTRYKCLMYMEYKFPCLYNILKNISRNSLYLIRSKRTIKKK